MAKLLYGHHVVQSMLQEQPFLINKIILQKDKILTKSPKLILIKNLAEKNNISCELWDKAKIAKLIKSSQYSQYQGVLADCKEQKLLTESELKDNILLNNKQRLLILDQVTDPHNFGAIIRSAAAFAIDGIIITKNNSVKLTPVVYKASAGTASFMKIYEITNLNRICNLLKNHDFWLFGADSNQGKQQNLLNNYNFEEYNKLAIIAGAEGSGLRDLTKKNCDFFINIPLATKVESLNVSNAIAIVLYVIFIGSGFVE